MMRAGSYAMTGGSRARAIPAVAICIPVRDEAAELPRLFDALDLLERSEGQAVHLCLLLDGCTDGSATLAERYRARSALSVRIAGAATTAPNAGRARHRAMMLGIEALGNAAMDDGGGILLTTDADSRPSPDWLVAMTTALAHADIVAGRVIRDTTRPAPLQDRIERYFDTLFVLRRIVDPVPWEAPRTHHQVSGANLGMRAATYVAIGGFPPLASGEDARLVDDAARAGLRVRRDAASVVRTSDRRCGRAAGGLAETLRDLDRGGAAAVQVAHPRDAMWQYRLHALARTVFDSGDFAALGERIGLDRDHITGVARDCPDAEAFAMRLIPAPPGGMRHVALPLAEAELAALPDDHGKARAA